MLYKTQSVELGVDLRRFLVLGLVLFALLIQPLAVQMRTHSENIYDGPDDLNLKNFIFQ